MADLGSRLQEVLGGGYRVERELGGGGMSRVFLAEETGLGRRVVVKVLPPDLAPGINAERFRREIQLSASLQHPHIVPVLAAGGSGDVFYYTMPLIEGESLRARLTRQGQLPVREAVRALRDVADALAHAHARGVVHRDIKPDNVLISHQHAVVTDFGVAKAVSRSAGDSSITSVGVALGTPAYMSPEQAAGDPDVDGRADVYALGAMGYEMLAGRPPFAGMGPARLLAAQVTERVPPLLEHRPDLPPDLANLLMRCLEKDPARRPQSAALVRDALDAIGTPTPVPPVTRRRHVWQLAAAGLAFVALALWLGLRSRPAPVLDANRIAVAPFDVLDPSLALWHEGLVDVLSRTLDGAGPLQAVAPSVVVRRWRGRADAASAAALGRETGARTVVFGGLVAAGADSVRLSATILDVTRRATIAEFELRGRSGRMDRIADSLAVRVLRELGRTQPVGLVRGAPLGSTSMPALKAFLQGEQFLRRSQWDSAIAYHQRAIAQDSAFALAWSHAGLAAGWAHSASDTLSLKYKLRAGSLNHGLAPRESLIVQAESLSATLYGLADQLGGRQWGYARRILGTLDEAVRRYPGDPELWYMLGDAAFHAGPLAGLGPQASMDAFDRSIALDSTFTPSYVHAIQLALELRGPDAARRYAMGYLRAGASGDYATAVELLLRLLDPRTARTAATLSLMDTMSMQGQHIAFSTVQGWPDSLETGLWVARHHRDRVLREARSAADTAMADRALVTALAFRGHLEEASHLGSARITSIFPHMALMGAVSPDTARAVLASWLSWKSPKRGHSWWALPWWAEQHDTAAIATLGRMADLALRDPPVPITATGREIAGYVKQAVPAYMALARGDSTAALNLFQALPDSACLGECELDALVRIRLLSARGQYREAARRLTITPVTDRGWWAVSPTRILWELERGRVNEQLGVRDAARTGYAYVLAAWVHPDSLLMPYVAEAREGLGRLSGDAAAATTARP
jgi:serine/threonine-protein kinase